jgi:hypothetical protein
MKRRRIHFHDDPTVALFVVLFGFTMLAVWAIVRLLQGGTFR